MKLAILDVDVTETNPFEPVYANPCPRESVSVPMFSNVLEALRNDE
jgi:hypothetical protein